MNTYFRRNPNHVETVRLTGNVAVIHKHVTVNGNKWSCHSQCEYVGLEDGRQSVLVGSIKAFLVVSFTVGGGKHVEPETTVFVQLRRMSTKSLRFVGPQGCGHYRVNLRTCTVQEEFVHVQALATLLCVVPDNRGRDGVALRAMEGPANSVAWTYLVPVAKAFAE